MEIKIDITNLTHDDLVNLFSTGLYGNRALSADYNRKDYDSIPEDKRIGNCFEDELADCLLNGNPIFLYDNEAEDEDEIYSEKGKWINGTAEYTITLKDIESALSREEALKSTKELFIDGTGDMYDGYDLLQLIMFGEIVY